MSIRLGPLTIENFKGISKFHTDFGGEHAVIKGANGTGKTSVLDAYSWLIDDKDSTGRVATGKGSFDITPLDRRGHARKGLVVRVEGGLLFDGTQYSLRKELHENITDKKVTGYSTRCWIGDVPMPITEFKAWIKERAPEDKYRLLSSLTYFFGDKFHWKKRRAVLCEFAGQIGKPQGFEGLESELNGRTVDQYLKVLKEQKALHEETRDEINPRIDETNRGMGDYKPPEEEDAEQSHEDDLRGQRAAVKLSIETLGRTRTEMLAAVTKRQRQQERITELCGQRSRREHELKTDTSGIQHLIDSKAEIVLGVADRTEAVAAARSDRTLKDSEVRTKNTELQTEQRILSAIQGEYSTTQKKPLDDACYVCGQPLPESMQAEIERKRTVALDDISKRGNAAMNRVDACKDAITALAHECAGLQERVGQAEIELTEAQSYRDEQVPILDAQIAQNEPLDPKADEQWKGIVKEVAGIQAELGDPVSEQLTDIEERRQAKINRQAELDTALAQADNYTKGKARIVELGKQERQLSQAIADIEKQIADIGKYKAAESAMVEAAVNGRFKYVEFKLFNTRLNGTVEDCCEATLKGVPYPDMSFGQKKIVGVDIINVLSEHYDLSVPLFVDNAESLTLPVEANSQVIELYALDSYTEKVIMLDGSIEEVYHDYSKLVVNEEDSLVLAMKQAEQRKAVA